MGLKNAIAASVILLTGSCWGPAELKDEYKDISTSPDIAEPMTNREDAREDTNAAPDSFVSAEVETCYETPDDPTTLIGQPCAWEEGAECVDEDPVIVCINGRWNAFTSPFEDPSEGRCTCTSPVENCRPADLECTLN